MPIQRVIDDENYQLQSNKHDEIWTVMPMASFPPPPHPPAPLFFQVRHDLKQETTLPRRRSAEQTTSPLAGHVSIRKDAPVTWRALTMPLYQSRSDGKSCAHVNIQTHTTTTIYIYIYKERSEAERGLHRLCKINKRI